MTSPLDHELSAPLGAPLGASLGATLGGRTASALEKHLGLVTVGDLLSYYPRRYARRGELTALSDLKVDESVTIVAEVLQVRDRPMRNKRGSLLEVRISDRSGDRSGDSSGDSSGGGFGGGPGDAPGSGSGSGSGNGSGNGNGNSNSNSASNSASNNSTLTLTFFNQAWRAKELRPGVRGFFAGKVGEYRGVRQLTHPDYELFEQGARAEQGALAEQAEQGALGTPAIPRDAAAALAWAETPIPLYPATASITSWQIRKALGVVLDSLPALDDPVPVEVRAERKLLPYERAVELIHRPMTDADWHAAQKSLRFQEAFVLQAALLQQRARLRATAARPRVSGALLDGFDSALPFTLTNDQVIVGGEVSADLASEAPMNRLIQGEVGSGKTLVALRAMLAVAESGGQSALLAPTEVLAHQHLRSIVATLGPDLAARLRPTLLTGQLSTAERKKALLAAVSGGSHIVVGTHALIGDAVSFFDLGLVVIDEQHRFGVDQREALRLKATMPPHVLVLTATPIPRTVAMTVFGDLDISTIAELPAGRSPIESFVVPLAEKPGWISRVWERIAEEHDKGHQVFVVCPAISAKAGEEGADDLEGASVEATYAEMTSNPIFANLRIQMLHGRLPSDEKDAVMRAFAAGEIDVLVATTVIEVGVDVPNASAMVVLDADRFGVSQLHQLRGRVGRGGVPGLCLFVTRAEQGTIARDRVDAVAATLDGFELAQKDLELRQEGDVLGSVQSGGRSSLRLLRVAKDGALISEARELAASVLDADPTLVAHPALAEALTRRLDAESEAFLAKN